MAKQTVNIGTTSNDRTGDSLRSAFNKINANFTELYTELGINDDADLNLGAFEFAGSVMTTTDSSAITIAQNLTVTNDITVGGDIVPNVTEEHNLGSSTSRFKDLYLSGSTIDLGGTTLSIVDGVLQVGGSNVAAGDIDYSVIQNTPAIPNLGNWTFSSSVLSDGSTGNAVIQSSDFAGSKLILRARGPSDKDWIFDQDGHLEMPGTFAVGGTGFVNLNNDAQGDTFYGGATTDKAILFLKGADYLAGSDNGGGVTIQGGSARNGGDNGDVIISSGNGGLSGTGSVSIIADNAVSLIATQISVAGEFTNTLNADISGSVFADDSTILVDGVAGKILGNVDTTTITNSNGNLTITADNYVLIDSDNGGQINIGQASGIGDVVLGNTARGTDVQLFGRLFVKGGGVPTTSIGASGDFVGIVAVDSDYLYYCTANYDGASNIWKRVAWPGDTW